MSDATYQPKVYRKQGGDELVIADGGTLTIEEGATVDGSGITVAGVTATAAEINKLSGAGAVVASGTQHAHVVDAKTDYTTLDLDTEAEIISALNTTNTKLNAVLAALEAFKINASA
jgi:hypothetical protein